MNTNPYSEVRFFNTLRDTIVAGPYAVHHIDEVNAIIKRIETLGQGVSHQCSEHAAAFLQAIDNARSNGYFPLVILPATHYETTLSCFR